MTVAVASPRNPLPLIDSERYPLDRGLAALDAVIQSARRDIAACGCAVLKGFVRREAIPALVAECDRVAPQGHRNYCRTNVYFTADRPELPPEHPQRRFYERSNAFVPADNFGMDSGLRALYEWPPFGQLVQAILQERNFHRYADPLADVIVNLAEAGGGFPWHFDTNNYTVTLAIQNAKQGGVFQFAPNLRSREDENYAGVQAILDGDLGKVQSLALEPGDLQVFKGRYSLHRVTPLAGNTVRYVAIFSYAERADMVGSIERTRQLYGRVLPIHVERAGRRDDALID
jgi:hypothetical protein